jgi:5'-deoxynucleotidase YfbR-like HD superfamily hydrolase
MTPHAQGMVDIGKLILQFAKTNRVTYHEDGVRLESDTDHTVMLSVCACALAERLYPDLDRGMIAQYAIVHDLVEAYVGDTDSFGISDANRAAKEEREHQSFVRIKDEFEDVFPWIPETIARYEALDTKEARFVKTVDKAMSKITHILNNGQYFKNRNLPQEDFIRDYTTVMRTAEQKYGAEFPEIVALLEDLMEEARKKTYELH